MRFLLAIGMLALVMSAYADPANLWGGCLIAHYCKQLPYSSDPPALGWCGEYQANYAITDHTEQVNRIDTSAFTDANWFVIAAWDGEEKTWCGTEFGLGEYDARIFNILEWDVCYPPDGGLEIPTPGWPGPNEGIAFVVTGAPWEGNYQPVMRFGGYAYAYYGSDVIPTDVDPPTAFAGFSNCEAPPVPFDAHELGGLGINMDGIYAEPVNYVPPTGACCFWDWTCEVLTEEECLQAGGWFLGPDTGCEPNPCPGVWVCCVEHECYIVIYLEECDALGGIMHVGWNTCEPNPCEIYTPVHDTSWGKVKGMYR